jgi:RNA polymerase sigma-70 factor (ECF subfamily)
VEGRPLDDAQLVERARHGDIEAYEELVQRHSSIAHRTAVLFAGSAEADDATQEAFVKAYRALGRFRAGSDFRPWLLRIVANEAKNRRRSAVRRSGLALRAATRRPSGDAAPSPEEAALLGERRRGLLDAVGRLPDKDRAVVTCRYLLDLSEAETAEVLGWPRGSVKSRLSRALDRLRMDLGATARPAGEPPGSPGRSDPSGPAGPSGPEAVTRRA